MESSRMLDRAFDPVPPTALAARCWAVSKVLPTVPTGTPTSASGCVQLGSITLASNNLDVVLGVVDYTTTPCPLLTTPAVHPFGMMT